MSVDFAPHSQTSNTAPLPAVISASTAYALNPAWKAFDGIVTTSSYWLGTNAGVDWLQVDLGPIRLGLLETYSVRVNQIPEPNRAPKNWTMLGSNNGSDWDTLDTVTNQTGWGSGESRAFTCDVQTTAYRYFRLNISANNGDATYTQVAELYLCGSNPPVQLAGAAAGSSSVSAALQVPVRLAGAAAGSSSVSAALQVPVRLAGAAAGSSTTVGAVEIAVPLGGSSAGAAQVLGRLAITIYPRGLSAGFSQISGYLYIPVRRRMFDMPPPAGSRRLFGSAAAGATRIVQLPAPDAGKTRIVQ